MVAEDADRWNQRYSAAPAGWLQEPRSYLVENAGVLPPYGRALDLAMGAGGNAGFLISRGLDVVGLDIAFQGVRQAKKRWPALRSFVADLTDALPLADRFDVLINFYFLERSLWREFENLLKPGGVLIFESLTLDMRDQRPDIDPVLLLQPGELAGYFSNWQVLSQREGWFPSSHGTPKAIASIVARRP